MDLIDNFNYIKTSISDLYDYLKKNDNCSKYFNEIDDQILK